MEDPQPLGEALPPTILERLKARGLVVDPAPGDLPDTHTETPEDARARKALQAKNRAGRWMARRPRMYEDAKVGDLLADAEQAEAANTAMTWWQAKGASSLVLAGTVGTGKTHLAYALGNLAVEQGRWVEVWTVADLLEDLRPNGEAGAERRARACDLLILDDLMAANVSPWAMETITTILDARIAQHRRQIVTTNAPSVALEETWGGRFMDRLLFHSATAIMRGESRRRGAW